MTRGSQTAEITRYVAIAMDPGLPRQRREAATDELVRLLGDPTRTDAGATLGRVLREAYTAGARSCEGGPGGPATAEAGGADRAATTSGHGHERGRAVAQPHVPGIAS